VKEGIHPTLHEVEAHCACGNAFQTRSTAPNLSVTLCSSCHPFYSGEVRFVDTAGKIEKFNKKFSKFYKA